MVSFVTYLPLLASVVLLQLSSGAVGPLDALSGVQLGYTPAQIGLLGSAHFLGFFIGCWWTPRLTGQVGHARAFAALTAAGAMGLLAHMMWTNPYAWALMRVATGMCVAGCYTVIEAWLQGRLTNETRGKAMGAYRVVDLVAGLAGQAMIGVLSPASYVSYNLLAIICCASLIPLAITTSTPPTTAKALKLRPMLAWTRSPLAVAGVVVSGVSGAAFRMVGPLYGQAQGLSAELLGLFLAAFVAGGALAQFPIGWLADRFDRRRVLIALSLLSLLASAGVALVADQGASMLILAVVGFGFALFPVFSVSAAHAHDFADNSERVELSAALLFFYALGAIGSPVLVSTLMATFGNNALFWMIAMAHGGLLVFGLVRMRRGSQPEARTPYVYTPRTSFTVGRLMKRLRNRRSGPTDRSL